jgi:hypothetical protein
MFLHGHDRPAALRTAARVVTPVVNARPAPVLRAAHGGSPTQLELPMFFSRPAPVVRPARTAAAPHGQPVPDTV